MKLALYKYAIIIIIIMGIPILVKRLIHKDAPRNISYQNVKDYNYST